MLEPFIFIFFTAKYKSLSDVISVFEKPTLIDLRYTHGNYSLKIALSLLLYDFIIVLIIVEHAYSLMFLKLKILWC